MTSAREAYLKAAKRRKRVFDDAERLRKWWEGAWEGYVQETTRPEFERLKQPPSSDLLRKKCDY